MEREQGRKDATADMSSDLSEGEKESVPQDSIPRVESALTLASSNVGESISSEREKPEKRLYIVLIRCARQSQPISYYIVPSNRWKLCGSKK